MMRTFNTGGPLGIGSNMEMPCCKNISPVFWMNFNGIDEQPCLFCGHTLVFKGESQSINLKESQNEQRTNH